MPKKPIDYSKCMFYRLVCRDPTVKEVYVGHTTSEVDRRATHKSDCTNEKSKKYNLFVYRFIRQHGSWENWQLIVHEKKPVKDIFEAVLQERKWCEFYKATLNKQVPSRTHAQYYIDHAEEAIKRASAWNVANEAHLKKKHECACGGCFTTKNNCKHFKTARHIAYQATL